MTEPLSPYIAESIRDRKRTQQLEHQQLQAIVQAAADAGFDVNPETALKLARTERAAKALKRRRYIRDQKYRTRLRDTQFDPIAHRELRPEIEANICYLCGHDIPPGQAHLEHVIPLGRGGTHTADNLRLACATCNLRKGNRTPEEFFASLSPSELAWYKNTNVPSQRP